MTYTNMTYLLSGALVKFLSLCLSLPRSLLSSSLATKSSSFSKSRQNSTTSKKLIVDNQILNSPILPRLASSLELFPPDFPLPPGLSLRL